MGTPIPLVWDVLDRRIAVLLHMAVVPKDVPAWQALAKSESFPMRFATETCTQNFQEGLVYTGLVAALSSDERYFCFIYNHSFSIHRETLRRKSHAHQSDNNNMAS